MSGAEQPPAVNGALVIGRSVRASAIVAATPEQVFALLADPHRHHELDGSGSLRGAVSGPRRLASGDRFGMRMRIGLPYRTTNRVVEFEPDRRISWCHFARALWRYELEAVDGGTLVTETFDYAGARSPRAIELMGFPTRNARSIEATLRRLQALFAPAQGAAS
ncbi:MAG TPA: SRPBCC family protein [Pseudonocardia sp.]